MSRSRHERQLNDIPGPGTKIIVLSMTVVLVLCSITLEPISIAVSASGSLSDSSDLAIPYAKVSQSSYFAPFRSFEDIFIEESLRVPDFPSPTHFSRELVTNEQGDALGKTMFGRVYISSVANGFLQETAELPLRVGETGNVTLRMERSGAIVGRVLDELGDPMPGVIVDISGLTIYNEQGQVKACEIYASDISGHDGTYVITAGIEPSCEYRIEASVPSYTYYSPWYLNPFYGHLLREGTSGSSLDNITVLAFKDPYHFDDRYNSLLFNSTTLQRVKLLEDETTVVGIVISSVTPGKERSGLISGKVIDVYGKPIPNTMVRASTEDETNISESMTDTNGSFVIRHVSAGNYTIDFQPQDQRLVARHVTNVLLEEGQNVNVGETVAERSFSIGGRVLLSDGTPLPGVFVDIKPVELDKGYEHYYPCESCIVTHFSDELDQRGTDKQGRYFLAKDLPPGTYVVSVNSYELRVEDRIVKLEPNTITVIADDDQNSLIENADLVFNYTIIRNYADDNDMSIRFFGWVKDELGNPVGNVGISARPDTQYYDRTDFQALTDDTGFYSMNVRQSEMPENLTNISGWTIYVHPTSNYGQYDIYYEDMANKSFAIYNYKDGRGHQNVVADWGAEQRNDFTLRKFTSDDILQSTLDIAVFGEKAKYSLPAKQFTFTTGYDNEGSSEDVVIVTNSTLIGSWIDRSKNVVAVELDPVAGTVGTMEISIPKRLATGINTILFDGKPGNLGSPHTRSAEIAENATHTGVILAYSQDFKKIELQAATVVPELNAGMISIIIAISMAGFIAIVKQGTLILRLKTKLGRKVT